MTISEPYITPTDPSLIRKYEFYVIATVTGQSSSSEIWSNLIMRTLVVGCIGSEVTITHPPWNNNPAIQMFFLTSGFSTSQVWTYPIP